MTFNWNDEMGVEERERGELTFKGNDAAHSCLCLLLEIHGLKKGHMILLKRGTRMKRIG